MIKPNEPILALDPAGLTGWAHSTAGSGVWCLNDYANRYIALRVLIHNMAKHHGIGSIAFEDAMLGAKNFNTQGYHAEMKGIILLCCAELKVEPFLFAPSTIKVFATGNFKAKKEQMMAACARVLGITPIDDNHADALWILELSKRPDCWAMSSKQRRRFTPKPTARQQTFFKVKR